MWFHLGEHLACISSWCNCHEIPWIPFSSSLFHFCVFFIAVSAAWRWIAGLWRAGLPPGPGSAALRTSWVQNPNPAAAWSLYQSHPNNITDTPEQPASCWETGTYCAPTWLKKPNNRRRYWLLLTTLVPQSGIKTVFKKTNKLYFITIYVHHLYINETLGHGFVQIKFELKFK